MKSSRPAPAGDINPIKPNFKRDTYAVLNSNKNNLNFQQERLLIVRPSSEWYFFVFERYSAKIKSGKTSRSNENGFEGHIVEDK